MLDTLSPEAQALKVGDKVRVNKNYPIKSDHGMESSIVLIDYTLPYPIKLAALDGSIPYLMRADELEIIQ